MDYDGGAAAAAAAAACIRQCIWSPDSGLMLLYQIVRSFCVAVLQMTLTILS